MYITDSLPRAIILDTILVDIVSISYPLDSSWRVDTTIKGLVIIIGDGNSITLPSSG